MAMKCAEIPSIDLAAAAQAQARQNELTKPTGSLGRLESLSIQLAGMTGNPRPRFHQKGVILMAGDHGVVHSGVSAYPPEVTAEMVANILRGGAAVSVLARQAQAKVWVVDMGVAVDCPNLPGLINRKIAYGTRNMLLEPAMTRAQAEDAIQAGIEIAGEVIDAGVDLLGTGEMGIGNTTPSSAITAVLSGLPVSMITGRGTGVDDSGLERKIEVIEQTLKLHQPDPADAVGILAAVGGFEIGGLMGVILGAAARRVPVVVDGFISAAAAALAVTYCPAATQYLIASHQSVEIGQRALWQYMGLEPLLDLQMRLGEGTGAVLAFHLLEAAAATLDEMSTFSDAGVHNKE
jgi:nicotinate-nucleotide--dimethylbenzimidazole phosphoribosyltransferase